MAKEKSCNRCGAGNLHWKCINGKWKLFDVEEAGHICRNFRRPSPDLQKSIDALTVEVHQLRETLMSVAKLTLKNSEHLKHVQYDLFNAP